MADRSIEVSLVTCRARLLDDERAAACNGPWRTGAAGETLSFRRA
ncbi:DUF3830 family protein [Streptomyces geysiriensis]|nr:DUF3830 family protein [Streptomyces geysiriensis]MBX4175221.1 DUF3830 family protein [Streptomyces geysiriensis]